MSCRIKLLKKYCADDEDDNVFLKKVKKLASLFLYRSHEFMKFSF